MNAHFAIKLLAASLLLAISTSLVADSAVNRKGLEVNPSHKLNGTRWLRIGSGLIEATKHVRLVRLKREGGGIHSDTYRFDKAEEIARIKAWLRINATPLLNTRSADDGGYSLLEPYGLYLYLDAQERESDFLLYMPLDDLFERFDDDAFKGLLNEWRPHEK